jgi:hypothetical protein
MRNLKYSVCVSNVTEFGALDDVMATDLTLNEAKNMAKKESKKAKEAGIDKRIFIRWFRATDGQHGYVNPDGNYSITGKSW